MEKVSIMGLVENLAFLGPLLLLVLMPAGFIGSAWVTNSVFNYLGRDIDNITAADRIGTMLLLCTLFTTYAYVLCAVFVEK